MCVWISLARPAFQWQSMNINGRHLIGSCTSLISFVSSARLPPSGEKKTRGLFVTLVTPTPQPSVRFSKRHSQRGRRERESPWYKPVFFLSSFYLVALSSSHSFLGRSITHGLFEYEIARVIFVSPLIEAGCWRWSRKLLPIFRLLRTRK